MIQTKLQRMIIQVLEIQKLYYTLNQKKHLVAALCTFSNPELLQRLYQTEAACVRAEKILTTIESYLTRVIQANVFLLPQLNLGNYYKTLTCLSKASLLSTMTPKNFTTAANILLISLMTNGVLKVCIADTDTVLVVFESRLAYCFEPSFQQLKLQAKYCHVQFN